MPKFEEIVRKHAVAIQQKMGPTESGQILRIQVLTISGRPNYYAAKHQLPIFLSTQPDARPFYINTSSGEIVEYPHLNLE